MKDIILRWEDAAYVQRMTVGAQHFIIRPLPARWQTIDWTMRHLTGRNDFDFGYFMDDGSGNAEPIKPPCQEGELRWTRESYCFIYNDDIDCTPWPGEPEYEFFWSDHGMKMNKDWSVWYKADHPQDRYPGEWPEGDLGESNLEAPKWQPPLRMPKWASRAILKIGKINIDRVQHCWPLTNWLISGEGDMGYTNMVNRARTTWNRMYRRRGFDYDDNPLVWWIETHLSDKMTGPMWRFSND